MTTENLYCSLASNSISFGAHGGSRPCCAVDTFFWKEEANLLKDYDNKLIEWFNNPDLVRLRKDLLNGKWNPICNLCKIREEAGQPSTRQIFNKTFNDIQNETGKSWVESKPVIPSLENIFLLDITVGNKCNSACLMCNPSASSLWMQEQVELGRKIDWLKPMYFDEKNALHLIDHLPNLRAIQFVGGEPTINHDHIVMLKKLVDQGRSKNITLGYVTNLTSISEELIEIWDHFSTKCITISVDGVGPVNEYIRYPFTWDKVNRGLERIKKQALNKSNYFIGLSHTVISLNILTLDEQLNWWEDQVLSNPCMQVTLPHVQCVNNPDYFDPVYMPDEMKKECENTLLRLEESMVKRGLGNKYSSVITNIRNNILNKKIDEEARLKKWLKMQKFCSDLDGYRKRNIFDYLPHIEKYWVK